MSNNEPDGIENATYNPFPKKTGCFNDIQVFFRNVLWVAFFQFRRAHYYSRITLYIKMVIHLRNSVLVTVMIRNLN
jgi:hypothetical protein